MRKVGRFMRSKAAVTAMILSTAILAGGCGEDAQAASDIAPKEPTPITTEEVTETEVEATESEAESITEDISISESEAREILKSYSDKISEANIEDYYYDELVYAFTTNFNEGKTQEAFNLALQHVIELRDFDLKTAEAEKARVEAEARETEANKLAEQQAKKESETPTENGSTGTDGSVPVTKEVAEQQPQTPPPAPTPAPAPQETPQASANTEGELTQAEKQALADKVNAEHAKITDPDDPRYGVHAYAVEWDDSHGSW